MNQVGLTKLIQQVEKLKNEYNAEKISLTQEIETLKEEVQQLVCDITEIKDCIASLRYEFKNKIEHIQEDIANL